MSSDLNIHMDEFVELISAANATKLSANECNSCLKRHGKHIPKATNGIK